MFYNAANGIETNAQSFPVLVQLTGQSGALKTDNEGNAKTDKNGRPLYQVRGQVMKLDSSGNPGAAFNVYVSTLEPLEAGMKIGSLNLYKADGSVFFRAMSINGSEMTTLVIDRLLPVTEEDLEIMEIEQDEARTQAALRAEKAGNQGA